MLLLLGFAFQISAQHTLRVSAPASVKGDYLAPAAQFFTNYSAREFSGKMVLVNDGTGTLTDACNPMPAGSLTGKIAMVDAGGCAFTVKSNNVRNAGAKAIVVVNSGIADPFAMARANASDTTNYPAVMISSRAAFTMKQILAGGTEIDAEWLMRKETGREILWGKNAKQGDFDGGLNGWVAIDSSKCKASDTSTTWRQWQWVNRYNPGNRGAYSGGQGFNFGGTSNNGAVVFDSDYYDNRGVAGNFGNGECAAPTFGVLVSPTIDLSAATAGDIAVEFWQSTRQFQSTYEVCLSDDNGATWSCQGINGDLPVNSANINREGFALWENITPTSTMKVMFKYRANYYYWVIDDVKLVRPEANNVRVQSNFFAIYPNAQVPFTQTEPVYFLADVANAGRQEAKNVKLTLDIYDPTLTKVFTTSYNYGSLKADSIAENQILPDPYVHDLKTRGVFTGVYTITADGNDHDINDNRVFFNWTVTDTVFAKETGRTRGVRFADAAWDATKGKGWRFGNFFAVPNGTSFKAKSIAFQIDNASAFTNKNQLLNIGLFKWTDDNTDQVVQPDERDLVGFGEYAIKGTEANTTFITVPLTPFDGDKEEVELENGGQYLAMVEWSGKADEPNLYLLLGASEAVYDYSAQIFITAPDQAAAGLQGLDKGPARYAPILSLINGTAGNADLDENWSTQSFGRDLVPTIRLNISLPVSTKDVVLEGKFDVVPNPANEWMNIQMNLDKPAAWMTIAVTDLSGRVVASQSLKNVQQNTIQFNTANLPAGTYMVRAISSNGTTVKKFTVQH